MKFTTWERIVLMQRLPAESNTKLELLQIIRVAKVLELTEDEKQQINWHLETTLEIPQFVWGDDPKKLAADHEWEVEIEQGDLEYLKAIFTPPWPSRPETVALLEKLGIS